MISLNPLFERIDERVPAPWRSFGKEGPLDGAPFAYPILDFYHADPISRASPTMAACVAAVAASSEAKTGTHG
jgi:NADH-quinone oxidoreductase subunit G